MILESSFVVDLVASDEGAVAELNELVDDAEALAVSALTVREVRRGLANDRDRGTFDDAMDDVSVIPFARSEARRAANLLRRLDADGTPVGAVVAMLAATALERNEKVLTRNVSEFDRIEGLRVVPY